MSVECRCRWQQQDHLNGSECVLWKSPSISQQQHSSLSLKNRFNYTRCYCLCMWLCVYLQLCREQWPPAWGQWTGRGSSPGTLEWTRLQSTSQSGDRRKKTTSVNNAGKDSIARWRRRCCKMVGSQSSQRECRTDIFVKTESSSERTARYVLILSPPKRRPRYSGIVTIWTHTLFKHLQHTTATQMIKKLKVCFSHDQYDLSIRSWWLWFDVLTPPLFLK